MIFRCEQICFIAESGTTSLVQSKKRDGISPSPFRKYTSRKYTFAKSLSEKMLSGNTFSENTLSENTVAKVRFRKYGFRKYDFRRKQADTARRCGGITLETITHSLTH